MSSLSLPRLFTPAKVLGVLVALAATIPTATASASTPTFGAYDVPTVFFINKSDDHNRVDYAIHLTDHCAPKDDDAVFPYWREFEHAPPVRIHTLGLFEYAAYGFADQHMLHRTLTGGEQFMKLKQFDRGIFIVTKKEADGKCSAKAYATIGGVEGAQLDSIYVKLAGALSVDYVEVHGKNPQTGAAIEERLKR